MLPVKFLVDSGSTYTLVDKNIYDQLDSKFQPVLKPVSLGLTVANGEKLKVYGETVLNLDIGGFSLQYPVKIVSLGNLDAILGIDILEDYDCVLRPARGILELGGKKLKLHRTLGENRCARITVAKTVHIGPEKEIVIQGHVQGNRLKTDSESCLVEPQASFTSKTGLWMARSLALISQDIIPISIVNPSTEPITLKQGEPIALLQPVETVCSLSEVEDHTDDKFSGVEVKDLPDHLQSLVTSASEELTASQRDVLCGMIKKNIDAFMGSDGKLGRTSLISHKIDTGNAYPIKQSYRRLAQKQQEIADEEIEKMLRQGIIEPSNSPWASPIVIVTKKDGTPRFCVDYRKLNDVSRKDAYPLPKIDECMDELAGAQWFCTLDLAHGYWQVEMDPDSKLKTAFASRKGLYHFNVMPFGLSTAPASFERLMELVLRGHQWERCLIFLDDVIVHGKTFEETLSNLDIVLTRFRKANLKLKPSKCHLFKRSVAFLGHVVSRDGVQTDPEKIQAVSEWPVPCSVKEVRSFLGFANYYRRFIEGFSTVAAPLHHLTNKDVTFKWIEECQIAFDTLKQKLVDSPLLSYPVADTTFILDTDASNVGIGAVLSQDVDGLEKVVAYGSQVLSNSQRNYCTTMKELLAVVVFIGKFKHYLYGRHFVVRTDHASLVWLRNFKNPEGMLARWLSVLGTYDFEIQHRPGNRHGNADGLSRRFRGCKRESCPDCIERSPKTALEGSPSWTKPETGMRWPSSLGSIVHEGIETGASAPLDRMSRSTFEQRYCFGKAAGDNLACVVWEVPEDARSPVPPVGGDNSAGNISFRESPGNPVSPATPQELGEGGVMSPAAPDSSSDLCSGLDNLSRDEIKRLQRGDRSISLFYNWISMGNEKPNWSMVSPKSIEVKALWNQWASLRLRDGFLYRLWTPETGCRTVVWQLVLPLDMRNQVMKLLHNHKTTGHMGTDRTLHNVRMRFYWPGYKADVVRWCDRCLTCESHKAVGSKFRAPLVQDLKGAPMETVACDIMGPLTQTSNGNVYILVVMDYFTKWVEAYALPNHTALVVADKLVNEWVCRYGAPLHLHSDQGRDFESNLFKEVCRLLDIRKTHTTPYHPQSDGQVERFNRTLKLMLRSFVNVNQNDWDDHLSFVTMAYRSSIHKSTKCTPNLLMFGREILLPIDIVVGPPPREPEYTCHIEYVQWLRNSLSAAYQCASENLEHSAEIQKRLYDSKGCSRKFNIGDWVWRWYPPSDRLKFGRGWLGPFLVIQQVNNVAYRIQTDPQTLPKVIHVNHLKPYHSDSLPVNWLEHPDQVDTSNGTEPSVDEEGNDPSQVIESNIEVRTRSDRISKPPVRYGYE